MRTERLHTSTLPVVPISLMAAAGAFLALSLLAGVMFPGAVDWRCAFYPAGADALALRNPYNEHFFNPFWTLPALMLLALPGLTIGTGLLFAASLASLATVAYKRGATPAGMALLLTSGPVFYMLYYGNLEWLVLLGLIMPPWAGVWFLLIKPQVGIGVVALWFVRAVKARDWKLVTLIATLTLVTLLFMVRGMQATAGESWNAALWPFGIIPGICLMLLAIHKDDDRLALGVGLLVAPHVLIHSYIAALVAIIDRPRVLFVTWGISWVIVLLLVL